MLDSTKEDISIVLCGKAGQGIQTIEVVLTKILKQSGYNVFATKEYMSRVRGGVNTTSIRVSSKRVSAPVDRIDVLVPLTTARTKHLAKRISPGTIVLEQTEKDIFANISAVGTLCAIFKMDTNIISEYLKLFFSKKGDEIVAKNIEAMLKGYGIGKGLLDSVKISIDVKPDNKVKDEMLLSGAEAAGLGAVCGGCDFISAYPMTPSTGVFTFLAEHSHDFGIVAEQAEDEISAINMSLGAWYAGARAMVATAGGGFALMVEGLSLSGMIETPAVIVIGQRPAPATGLPTRTEQGDLNFALYSGHGEFPRIIFAPGTIEDTFYVTQKAFDLADKYQAPVIILVDQLLMDSYNNIPSLNIEGIEVKKYFVETSKDYKRYVLTKDGISPRGIPGFGSGLVAADSDEHDEEGHITEDLELRTMMVDKRLKKFDAIKAEAMPAELIGSKDYETLIIAWGSTNPAIKEALETINSDKIAFLYFKQVYPLPSGIKDYLTKAKRIVIIENNATCQFGDLIKLHTGFEIKEKILKYSGLAFSVEEIIEGIKKYG